MEEFWRIDFKGSNHNTIFIHLPGKKKKTPYSYIEWLMVTGGKTSLPGSEYDGVWVREKDWAQALAEDEEELREHAREEFQQSNVDGRECKTGFILNVANGKQRHNFTARIRIQGCVGKRQ